MLGHSVDTDFRDELAERLGARVIDTPALRPLDSLLGRRGFTEPLAHVPLTTLALMRGGFHAAVALSPTDAVAALTWRRRSGRPVAFVCTEALDRDRLADARLRFYSLRRAVEEPDLVLAGSEDVRAALKRWFAVDVPVANPAAAVSHVRDLLA